MGIRVKKPADYEKAVKSNNSAVRILALGDSWLAYPGSSDADNIVKSLISSYDVIVYDLSKAGKEITEVISNKSKKLFLDKYERRFKDTKRRFNKILLSAGGNDIVGKRDFISLLLDRDNIKDNNGTKINNPAWEQCINKISLDNRMNVIISVYEDLITRLKNIDNDVKIVTHNYGIAVYSKKGFWLGGLIPIGGNWMDRFFKKKNIKDENDRKEIVKYLLTYFGNRLKELENKYPGNIKVVDTRSIIGPDDWRNEIHLTPGGYRKITKKIYEEGLSI